MLQTRLWKSLNSLPAQQLAAFSKFLASPYFNQRADLSALLTILAEGLLKSKPLSKETVWQGIFPNKKFKEQELRLLMSYLQRLFEKFIAIENLLEDKIEIKLQSASWYRKCGVDKLHKSTLKHTARLLEKQPLRNSGFYFHTFQNELEKYRIASRSKPDAATDFQKIIDNFDLAFISMKLRQSCLMVMHDSVYKWGFDPGFLPQVFAYLEKRDLLNIPAISIYYYCYRMLDEPEEETWFQSFKKEFFKYGHLFKFEEVQDLFLAAINYGIRQVNDGNKKYFEDIIDFYRLGLDKSYLLQDGILSRFTYHNIVATALQIDLTDWAETFIEEWTPLLEKRFRERTYSFNLAKIAYHRKDYDAAIPLLQRSNYHDLLLNLGARTLLLKIYHELNEYDLLQSHLDAFSSYLRRKKGLGYHRKNYRNLILYTNRLLSLNINDRKAVTSFKAKVLGEEILTEKEWLLERVA